MNSCTECGDSLAVPNGFGLCAACSLRLALFQSESEKSSSYTEPLRAFGDYEMLDEIDRGGMGVVFRARQKSLNRIVAIKVILGGAFAGEEGKRRLRAEAGAAARLQHPNIVTVHEAGEIDGQPFYTMDFVDGETLADVTCRGAQPPKEAARCVATIATAIQYAHAQGVLHRDLKPSNILMDAFGSPRVSDFGLAKDLSSSHTSPTLTGEVIGSPAYMAPEQSAGRKRPLTPASDIYSLGAILYELLTGRPPFQGETVQSIVEQARTTDAVPPRRLNTGIPVDLETICLKCLEKDTAHRYASAQDLAEDLERFLRNEPVRARPLNIGQRSLRWARRHPAVAALVALCSALLVLVLVLGWLSAERIRLSRDEARARLAESLLSEARAVRIAGEPGHRKAALARLEEARKLDSIGALPLRLRHEAIAALARPDIQQVTVTNIPNLLDAMLMAFDPQFEHCSLWQAAEQGIGVFRLSDGKRQQLLAMPKAPDEIQGFSADGKFLALRFRRRTALWHVPSGIRVLAENPGEKIVSLGAFSHTDLFARAEPDERVAIYRLENTEAPRATLVRKWTSPFKTNVISLAWSPREDHLALVGEGGHLAVCEVETGKVRWSSRSLVPWWQAAWDKDRDLIAVQSERDIITLLDGNTGTERRQFFTPGEESSTMVFAENGLLMATASEQMGVRFFDSLTGELLLKHSLGSWHLRCDNRTRRLGTFFEGGQPAWITWQPSAILQTLHEDSSIPSRHAARFSHRGDRLAALTGTGVIVWDVQRGAVAQNLVIGRAVNAVFTGDDSHLLVSKGNSVLEFPLDNPGGSSDGKAPKTVTTGTRFWEVAVAPKAGWIAAADHQGGFVQILDRNGGLLRKLGPIIFPDYVDFSPDERWLACGTGTTVFIWDIRNFDLPPQRLDPVGEGVHFSGDGRWLATVGQQLLLWEVGEAATWRPGPALPLEASNAHPISAAFSRDGHYLAATQKDREIHLIDLHAPATVAILEAPGENRVLDLEFSPDGERLSAVRDRGEVQIWHLPSLRRELAQRGLDW